MENHNNIRAPQFVSRIDNKADQYNLHCGLELVLRIPARNLWISLYETRHIEDRAPKIVVQKPRIIVSIVHCGVDCPSIDRFDMGNGGTADFMHVSPRLYTMLMASLKAKPMVRNPSRAIQAPVHCTESPLLYHIPMNWLIFFFHHPRTIRNYPQES
ncbi:hypothetical protein P691DRAFT_304328 [Macrolepiota fuliginosa MF-IS2]|uniref:Uncharacterized protein n=1 Tax=Macrolepiota fuliginosa MF-IS2 TaxID=1400762 RepID=A0A9P5X7L9_9AGAR|nr:hypothetical protein P691DRAFT_304328 [Macrolepiota fuliginosa MF-IS2]